MIRLASQEKKGQLTGWRMLYFIVQGHCGIELLHCDITYEAKHAYIISWKKLFIVSFCIEEKDFDGGMRSMRVKWAGIISL